MTLKEIALELLKKYQTSETSCIWEYSGDIAGSERWLSSEVQKYKELIEATADVVERKTGEWIPCSEQLPEHEGDYLVTFQLLYINPVEVCYFDGQAWDKGQYDAVLAWMPLLEPYSGADMRGDNDG